MSKAAQLVPFSSYMEAFLGHLVDRFNFFPLLHLCGGMSRLAAFSSAAFVIL